MHRLRLAVAPLAALALSLSAASAAQASVAPTKPPQAKPAVAAAGTGTWATYHHDNAHTGYDPTQPAATGATAGWVTSALDGEILAEPLVFNGLVFAATLQGTVYAIDQSTGTVSWSKNVGTPTTWSGQCGNINPLGIAGTPVIDTTANRIYVTENLNADKAWHVFGIDLTSHNVVMDTTIPTSLGTGLDWTIQQDRGALTLANGNVYVPFGGRIGDCGPYHGWVFAVPTNGSPVTSFYQTPGDGAGFWASGGVVVDDATGKVFESSGNGTGSGCAEVSSGGPPVYENDAVVRMSATLAHEDAFMPLDWHNNWCINDQDLGSATMVIINSTLAFQAGKWGQGFLVNPQALGGQNGQLFPSPSGYTGADVCRGNHNDANFGSYAYAAPYVYLGCESNGLVALSVDTTAKTFVPCGSTCSSPSWNAGGFRPGPPIVAGGAVWAVDTSGGGLYGFNASTGAQIYHSAAFGGVNHFATPSEAGGQIFVASSDVIRSFNMTTGCSTVTLTATPASSQTSGSAVMLTGAASGSNCSTPLYQFWMRPSSGSWSMLQDYTSSATFNWTSTTPPGSYFLGVHAKQSGSTAPYEALASIPYQLTAQSCSSVTLVPTPTSPQPSGTPVRLTASSTCPNPNPLYAFWAKWQGSSMWQLLQNWSTSATYNWNSTGALAGTENFGVWVRDAASPTPFYNPPTPYCCWDALTSIPYTVTTPSCASVSVTASPTSVVHGSGTHSTITATASGCTNANPLYEFWMRTTTTGWQLVQGWSSTATYDWNSTGAPVTTVYFGAWVKDASSPNTYDAVNSTTVTVT